MDKVKLVQDERLDIVDATRLQTLVYEYLSKALAGIIGLGSGVLTRPATENTVSNGVITTSFAKFEMLHTEHTQAVSGFGAGGAAGAADGISSMGLVTLTFDPADPNQTQDTLDPTPYRANKAEPYAWARWEEVDTEVDTRRKWSAGASSEVAFATETKTRRVIALQLNEGVPVDEAGSGKWFRIGKIVMWSGVGDNALPVYSWFSVFDAANAGSTSASASPQAWESASSYFERAHGYSMYENVDGGVSDNAGAKHHWSLMEMLNGLIANFVYLYNKSEPKIDGGNSHARWFYPDLSVTRGIVQINDAIDNLSTSVLALEGKVDELITSMGGSDNYVHSTGTMTYWWFNPYVYKELANMGDKFTQDGVEKNAELQWVQTESSGFQVSTSTTKSGKPKDTVGKYVNEVTFSVSPQKYLGTSKLTAKTARIVQVIVTGLCNESLGPLASDAGQKNTQPGQHWFIDYLDKTLVAGAGSKGSFRVRTFGRGEYSQGIDLHPEMPMSFQYTVIATTDV